MADEVWIQAKDLVKGDYVLDVIVQPSHRGDGVKHYITVDHYRAISEGAEVTAMPVPNNPRFTHIYADWLKVSLDGRSRWMGEGTWLLVLEEDES